MTAAWSAAANALAQVHRATGNHKLAMTYLNKCLPTFRQLLLTCKRLLICVAAPVIAWAMASASRTAAIRADR